jgi:hypothetical protein
MVSKLDRLTSLLQTKGGLTEAILLPFISVRDLVVLSSVNKAWRACFDPQAHHKINLAQFFMNRLAIPPDTIKYGELYEEFLSQTKWIEVLKIVYNNSEVMHLVPNQRRN